MINIITQITDIITKLVETNPNLAYFFIGFSMFLENIIPPIPSEIIMPLGGFFVYQGSLNLFILICFGLLGTVLGAIPWYFLGRLLNQKRIVGFVERKGKFIGLTSKDILKSKLWFDKYGTPLVFWGRLVPGVRTLISVPAGIELMPFGKFLIWTSLGSLIWVSLLTFAGYIFGENYKLIAIYLDNLKVFLRPILLIILIFFFFRVFKKLKNN